MCIGAQIWDLAVLRVEFGQSQNAVCLHLRYKVQIAPIVVSQRPQILGICSLRCAHNPHTAGVLYMTALQLGRARGY